MNFNFKIITFCLATSALIVPAPKAFGAGALHQVEEQKILHWVCVKEIQNSWKCQFENSQQPKAVAHSKSTLAKSASNYTWQLEVFLLLTFISSSSTGLVLYIRHRNNRVAERHKNVDALERALRISKYQGN